MQQDIHAFYSVTAEHANQLSRVADYLGRTHPLMSGEKLTDVQADATPWHALTILSYDLQRAVKYFQLDDDFYFKIAGGDSELFHLRFWHVVNALRSLVKLLPCVEKLYDPDSGWYPQVNARTTHAGDIGKNLELVRSAHSELRDVYQSFSEVIGEDTYTPLYP